MSEGAHTHRWKTYRRVDFCHYVQLSETCEDCGIPSQRLVRRDFTDGTQLAFANQDCSACRRMVGHHQPTHWTVVL